MNSGSDSETIWLENFLKFPDKIIEAPQAVSDKALRLCLFMAGWAATSDRLVRGEELIKSLPREWVLKNIERVLEGTGWDEDVYVARLMLSLFDGLDRKGLCKRAVERCKESSDADVRELGAVWK